jgi:hypothetical protein
LDRCPVATASLIGWFGMASVVLAACGTTASTDTMAPGTTPRSRPLPEVTTITEPVVSSESTTPPTAHSTSSVEIPSRFMPLEPGVAHEAGGFAVALKFTPEEASWRSSLVTGDFLGVVYVDPEDAARRSAVVFVLFRSQDPLEEVAEAVTSIDGVEVAAGPVRGRAAGRSALVVDVEGAPKQLFARECSYPGGTPLIRYFAPSHYPVGYELISVGYDMVGIPACWPTRIWLVDVDGTTVTVLASTDSREHYQGLMETVERLLAVTEFGGAG